LGFGEYGDHLLNATTLTQESHFTKSTLRYSCTDEHVWTNNCFIIFWMQRHWTEKSDNAQKYTTS